MNPPQGRDRTLHGKSAANLEHFTRPAWYAPVTMSLATCIRWTSQRCVSEAESILDAKFIGAILIHTHAEYDPAERNVPGWQSICDSQIVIQLPQADRRRKLPATLKDQPLAKDLR